MNGWEKDHISSYAEIIPGYAFDSRDFKGSGIPVIKISNVKIGTVDLTDDSTQYVDEHLLNSLHLKYRVSRGDILISLTGSHLTQPNSVVGRVGRYRYDFNSLVNQRAAKIEAIKGKSDKDFIYHLLSTFTLRREIAMFAHGAANQANVSHKDIEKIKVFWPALPIQRKIAAVLSAYDDLIENNNRRIVILEKMAEELYREWFVRLRFPGHEKVKIVKGVPDGWKLVEAGKYMTLVKGRSYSSDEISDWPDSDTHLPFINLKNFNRGGGYRPDGIKYYSGKYNADQCVAGNAIVLAVTDMTQDRAVIGRVARIPMGDISNGIISCDVTRIVPANISETFLYALLRYSRYSESLKEYANGANVLHLKPELARTQKIIMPQKDLRDAYDKVYQPILTMLDACLMSQKNLSASRDRLLSRLMSGKIDVEKMDIHYPESMKEGEALTYA